MAEQSFRDDKERQIWQNLVNDLGKNASRPEEVVKVLGALTAAVGILPTDAGIKQALLNAVRKFQTDAKTSNLLTKEWLDRLSLLQKQVLDAGNAVIKPPAAQKAKEKAKAEEKVAAARKAHPALEAKKRAEEQKVLRKQLIDVSAELRKKPTPELIELKKNLVLQLVALESKNDDKFGELRKAFKDIRADDMLDRLDTIRRDVQDSKKKIDKFWGSVRGFVNDTTRRTAQSIGIGGFNLYNAYRVGRAVNRGVDATFGMMGAGYRALRGTYDINQAKRAYAIDESDGNSTNNLVDAEDDKKEKQRRDFLGMYAKQLDLMKDLTGNANEENKAGGKGLFGSIKDLLKMFGAGAAGAGAGGLIRRMITGASGSAKAAVVAVATLLATQMKRGAKFLVTGGKKLAMTVLKFLGRGAIGAIPIVGPLIAALMLADDAGIIDGVKNFVAPMMGPFVENIASFFTQTISWTKEKFAELYDSVRQWVDPITSSVSNAFNWVNDTLYGAYTWIRDLLSKYAEKWKDVPMVGSVLKNLSGFMNDPKSYSASLAKGVGSMISKTVGGDYDLNNKLVGAYNSTYNAISGFDKSSVDTYNSFYNKAFGVREHVKNAGMGYFNMMGSALSASGDFLSKSYTSLTGALDGLFTTSGRVDLANLDPRMQNAFLNAVEEYKMRGGDKKVVITSGYRSVQEQAGLHARNPAMAAPPGQSLHNYGLAIDADRNALNEMEKMGILARHGLSRPISNEPWHVQPIGLASPAADAGVFSADAPTSQGFSSRASSRPTPQTTQSPSIMLQEKSTKPVDGEARLSRQGGTLKEGASQKMDVNDISMFSYSDGGFFALNLGILNP